MSSISFRRPEFRLHLGYPDIVLTSSGRTLGRVATEAGDFLAALRRMAGAVLRARGRLVAVLPDSEVWRGRLDLAGRDRAEQRSSARTIVAGRLGTSPDEVTVVLGARDAAGSFPVAGVRRSTLLETRALLAAVGLRPSAIVAAPGFVTSPRLDGGWSWPLPALPPERRGLGAAVGAGAIVSLAVLVLGMPATQPTPLVVTAPTPVTVLAEAVPLRAETPLAATLPPAPPPSLALSTSGRPKPRPEAARLDPMVTVAARNMPKDLPLEVEKPRPAPVPQLQRLAELTAAPVRALDAISAPLRRPAARHAAAAPAPDVTEIARTAMPVLPAPAAVSDLRPMHRPRTAAPAPIAPQAAKPVAASEGAALTPRPRERSGSSQAAVLVASLDPAPFAEASLAAAAVATVAGVREAPPPARPVAPKPVAKPAPVAKAAPVVVRPKPVEVQQLVNKAAPQRTVPVAAAAPQRQTLVAVAPKPQVVAPQSPPVRQKVVGKPFAERQTLVVAALPKAAAPAAPVRQKVVAKPVPVKKVAVKKAAAKAVPAQQAAKDVWAPEPVTARPPAVGKKPVKAKPAAQRVGLSRGNISLVGVFGGANGRTALVRLPNGSIEKVKAGDQVQGVQIAAINEDSVQVSGRGRDTLLRLPD